MNLSNFLKSNNVCALCGKQLDLFLQVTDGPLWKAISNEDNIIKFQQVHCINRSFLDEQISLVYDKDNYQLEINNNTLASIAKTWALHLFYFCGNIQNNVSSDFNDDYIIDALEMCYYTSSSFFEFSGNNRNLQLCAGAMKLDNFTRDEIFVFQVLDNFIHKIYILSFYYEDKFTIFKYFIPIDNETNPNEITADVFEKVLPLMQVRPDFSLDARHKLIERFNSWILMS